MRIQLQRLVFSILEEKKSRRWPGLFLCFLLVFFERGWKMCVFWGGVFGVRLWWIGGELWCSGGRFWELENVPLFLSFCGCPATKWLLLFHKCGAPVGLGVYIIRAFAPMM
jgi:hypothetical protein